MCRIQNQRTKAPPAPTSTSLSIPERKAEALPSTAPPSRGFEREFAPEEFGLRLPPSLAELRKKYSREKGSTASAQAVVPKPEQITAPTTRPVANSTVKNSKAKDTPPEDTTARQVLFCSDTYLSNRPACLLLTYKCFIQFASAGSPQKSGQSLECLTRSR